MNISKDTILKEISSNNHFADVFFRCNGDLRDLFLNLVSKSSYYSCNNGDYIKNMARTSVRLSKPYSTGRRSQNYCMFTLNTKQNGILVDVRTDGKLIESKSFNLINIGNRYNGGFEWYRFSVRNNDDIEEAINIISKCYEL